MKKKKAHRVLRHTFFLSNSCSHEINPIANKNRVYLKILIAPDYC